MFLAIYKNTVRLFSLCTLFILYISCNPLNSRIASEHDEYAWLGSGVLFEQKNTTIVVGIKRHGDVYFYKENHGSATKAMQSSYYLETYDAENMRRIAGVKIDLNDDDKKGVTPQIIGKDAEKIWIFTDQLTAYHPSTLAQVADRKKIEQKNPGLKALLLNKVKYYRWDNRSKAIHITTADGKICQLNTQTLAVSPATTSSENKVMARKRNRREDLWRSGSERAFISSQDTMGNTFFGLYSTEELPVYARSFRNDAASSLDAVRSLWSTSINYNNAKMTIDINSLEPLSDKKFINGFFLVNRNTSGVFHCTNPSGLIIGYKTAIGKSSLINFARVARDGNEVWSIETNIREIKGLDFTDRYMLIQASQSDSDDNHLINKMYSIRLTDGKMLEARS